MINKAEIGDFLYIIIFVVLALAGVFEKMAKAKKQQQTKSPTPPHPYDDFEDVETQPAPAQTLEEMIRRMMHPAGTEEAQSLEVIPAKKAQSLEDIADSHFYYQPVVCPVSGKEEQEAFALSADEEIKVSENRNFEFDIRQAVIANEILNRKY